MTSKNLFFKVCLHDFKKRIWSFAIFFVIMFFAFPVNILLTAQNNQMSYMGMDPLWLKNEMMGYYERSYGVTNFALAFFLVAGAVLLALNGFSYLNSRKKSGFCT